MGPHHHSTPLAVRTDLLGGPPHRKLPSLEQSGLRPFLGSTGTSQVPPEMVQQITLTMPHVRCRGSGHDVCISSMTPEDRHAYTMYDSCHRCTLGPTNTITPQDSTCNSPLTMYDQLEQLECSSPSSYSSYTTASSVCSEASGDRKLKRRRGPSPPPGIRNMASPADLRHSRLRQSDDVRKEKKEKEQDARNGQKEQVQEMEMLVTKHWGCEGMTELNQNNSKASGLKYKKVEVYNGAVSLIKYQVQEGERREKRIRDLEAELRKTKRALQGAHPCSGSAAPAPGRGSRL